MWKVVGRVAALGLVSYGCYLLSVWLLLAWSLLTLVVLPIVVNLKREARNPDQEAWERRYLNGP